MNSLHLLSGRQTHPLRKFVRRHLVHGLLLATLVATTTGSAQAEEVSAEDKAAARDLALEGIQLAQTGNCAQALDKLHRADALFHAPTILTWLGQCQIQLGHLVEGTETLNQVVREKTGPDAPEAYLQAQRKAATLIASARPKIAKLTIEFEASDLKDLVILVDGKKISNALVGAPRPTDPGPHSITVHASGYLDSSQKVDLEDGAKETIRFTLSPKPQSDDPIATPAQEHEPPQRTNWVAWTTVGVGGALMAAGGVTGFLALSKKNSLDCNTPATCAPSEQDTLDAANLNATLSTVFFGVGGAAVVTGVVLLVIGKPAPSAEIGGARVQPVVGLGSLGLLGEF